MASADVSVALRKGTIPRLGTRFVKARTPGLVALAAFILGWHAIVVITDIRPILFPPPLAVWEQLVEVAQKGLLANAFSSSMQALAIGMVAAIIAGTILGIAVGASPKADLVAAPYLWAFFATPRIALAPLMVLWFGFGMTTKTYLVFLSAVIPIMISCKEGVQTVDESLVRASAAFCADRRQFYTKVVVPNTLPFIASGIRNGISRGFVGLLVVEMTVGSGGIGTEVMRSMRSFNTARMFAFVAVLVTLALVLISASKRLEAYASRWREDVEV